MGLSGAAAPPGTGGDGDQKKPGRERRYVESLMAFANPSCVFPDQQNEGHGKRLILPKRPGPVYNRWDMQRIRIHDLALHKDKAPGDFEPDLFKNGFAVADLSAVLGVQEILHEVVRKDSLGLKEVSELSRHLTQHPIPLGRDHIVEVLEVDEKSLYMRKSGPDGMSLGVSDRNKQGFRPTGRTLAAAVNVHTDGDVDNNDRKNPGWKQRFNHHENPSAEMFVLNFWIALQQPVRPLAVMDTATLDRKSEQVKLQYELPQRADGQLDFLLGREEAREPTIAQQHVLLHRPTQDWYFKSDLGPEQALVFDTMSTPHGTFLVPGEGELAQLYRQLERAQGVLAEGGERAEVSIGALTFALWPDSDEPSPLCPDAGRTPARVRDGLPLRSLLSEMEGLVREGRARAARLCRAPTPDEWQGRVLAERADYLRRVKAVLERSSRKSIEIRCAAIVRRRGVDARSLDLFSTGGWRIRLPRELDHLGIVESLCAMRIPYLRIHGWVILLALYILCSLVLMLPRNTFAIA